jgi:hypothetical protein
MEPLIARNVASVPDTPVFELLINKPFVVAVRFDV